MPTELMPRGFQTIKLFNPLSTTTTLLVNSGIKNLPWESNLLEIANLAGTGILGIAAGYKKYF